ncbi:MAG TPA: PEGA domain-containing protein, partial [Kofleriaceae bacterium]|nr:PEGA domain-containing protein [Kofleriaceae bacterium]
SVGAIGKTPMSQNIKPGKHTFWISAEGYDEYTETVDIAAGEAHAVKAMLKGTPVGQLDIVGLGLDGAKIFLDGKPLCDHAPCIRKVGEGEHTVEVKRPGYKPLVKSVTVQAKTETSLKVNMSPEPGRGDAIAAYVVTAIFLGGAIYAGEQANDLKDQLSLAIAKGNPPPSSNDSRILKGKIYAISADAGFGIAAIAGITAIVYTFRDKGSPSLGAVDMRALAIQPEIGPNFAGLGVGGAW